MPPLQPPTSPPKFLGLLSSSHTHTLYAASLLLGSLAILVHLPASLLEPEPDVDDDEEGRHSRAVLELAGAIVRLFASTATLASLLSLAGSLLARPSLQALLRAQALASLFAACFSTVALTTLLASPALLGAASHELCLFALRSDSLPTLARVPDPAGAPLGAWLAGENCDERAASALLPALGLLLAIDGLLAHLIYVLFATPAPRRSSLTILPTHSLPTANYPPNEKDLIEL